MGQKQKPEIAINLDGGEEAEQKSFSTLDKIEGSVTITTPYDTTFLTLDIDFIGTSKTYVERLTTSTAINGRTEAFHQFLKLSQPIFQSELPADQILVAGQKYTFPFVFVVPQRMLPRICRHGVDNENVHDAHINLPPSLGDRDGLTDDFAPDMASIRYAVAVRLVEVCQSTQKPLSSVKVKKVRILPAVDEQPPVDVDGPESEYTLRKEKKLKKGVLKGRLGMLVAEVAQPKSLRLPANGSQSDTPITTMATVMLRFDPAESNLQPPRLNSLAAKLKVATFFASKAARNFPKKSAIQWDLNQGYHSENLSLASRCVANVEWTHHKNNDDFEMLTRRDSAFSASSSTRDHHPIPQPSARYHGGAFYTAQILVPVSLPRDKLFVPTFHSCLISRVYSLTLHLEAQSAGVGNSSIELKTPLQVSSEPNIDNHSEHRPSLTAEEEAIEAREADEFFQSRTISPLAEELQGASNLISASGHEMPPEYEAFARSGRRVTVAA